MEYLLEIMKKVAVFYVIAYFLMNLVNNEKYRHYIKMFVGIVMIIMLISPVGKLLGFEDKFLRFFSVNNAGNMSDELREELKMAENDMKDAIVMEYSTQIEEDIRNKLLSMDAYLKDCRIKICTEEDKENFGQIIQVDLTVSNKRNQEIEIPDIIIGDDKENINPVAIEIKKYISDVFKINKDNINENISL